MIKFPILFAANAQVQESYKYHVTFNVLSIDAGATANGALSSITCSVAARSL